MLTKQDIQNELNRRSALALEKERATLQTLSVERLQEMLVEVTANDVVIDANTMVAMEVPVEVIPPISLPPEMTAK